MGRAAIYLALQLSFVVFILFHHLVITSRHKLAAVISWPPSPNLEIATNLKADCNRKWSIIITFMLFIRFKHCTKTYLSVWPN